MLNEITVPLFAAVLIVRSMGSERRHEVVRSHEPIIDAIERKDPIAIEEAVKFHIQTSYDHFLSSTIDAEAVPRPAAFKSGGINHDAT